MENSKLTPLRTIDRAPVVRTVALFVMGPLKRLCLFVMLEVPIAVCRGVVVEIVAGGFHKLQHSVLLSF